MQGNDWVHFPPWLFYHFDLLYVYRGCGRKPDHQGKKPTQTGKTQRPLRIKKPEVNLLGPSLSHCAAPGTWGPGSNQRPCEQWCLQEKTSQGEWWCIIPFSYQYSEWVLNEYSVMTCSNVQWSKLHSALHHPSLPAGTVSVSSLLPHAVLIVTKTGISASTSCFGNFQSGRNASIILLT